MYGEFHTRVLLDWVEPKAFRLINFLLSDRLQLPFLHHNDASLAFFYRYFHASCSSDFVN